MLKNKKAAYFVLILIFAIIFILEKKQLEKNLNSLETESAQETNATQAVRKNAANQSTSNPVNTTSEAISTAPVDSTEYLKAFSTWLQTEAKKLNDRVENQADKEDSLRKLAQSFSPGQMQTLKQAATDTKATANERILAVYLLTLGSNASTDSLKSVATQPLSLQPNQPVHSLGETQVMQEKAIRTMAIDEMFSRASQDPNLRGQFLQMAQQIQDPSLKQYALQRYQQLK